MKYILNSRPVEHRARFHEAFAVLGNDWTIIDCPVLTAEPMMAQLPPPGGFDLILFTSQIAAALFPMGPAGADTNVVKLSEDMAEVGGQVSVTTAIGSAWAGKKVLAVGEATANTARAVGFTYVIDTGKDVDDMRAYLARAGFGQALYPSAEEVSADLSQEFSGRVKRVVTYRMVPRAGLDLEPLAPGWTTAPVVAPLFSRRSAETLADLLSKALPPPDSNGAAANITAVAISADVAVSGPWTRTIVADDPTLAGVAAACARAVK